MRAPGGPLRFLVMIIGGWTMVRIVMLLPASVQTIASAPPPTLFGTPAQPRAPFAGLIDEPAGGVPSIGQSALAAVAPAPPAHTPMAPHANASRIALALLAMIRVGSVSESSDGAVASVLRPADFPSLKPAAQTALSRWPGLREGQSRWSGSAWLVARGGQGLGAGLTTSQIGGGQAGVRLAYAIDAGHRLALAGRVAAPLSGRGKEAAIGLEWQPTRLPVRMIAEQRIALDGAVGGGGPAIGVIGGFGPSAVARTFRLEAYGQAGAIKRRRMIGYVDGAIRLNRQIALIGDTGIDIGAGSWGAMQPGAARLDLGPSIGVRLPINDDNLRLSLDWRQRVAGNARPGSGAALTIGADF